MLKINKLIKTQLRKNPKKIAQLSRVAPPKHLEREYEREIRKILEFLKQSLSKNVLNKLNKWDKAVIRDAANMDIDPDDVSTSFRKVRFELAEEYPPQAMQRIAERMGITVQEFNAKVLKEGFKRVVGIDLFFEDVALQQQLSLFAAQNTNLISSLVEDTLSKTYGQVIQGFATGDRFEEIQKRILDYINPEVGNVASRAKLIARDQVNKLNGQINAARQSELGIVEYIWRTSLDERVRESHRAKEGKKFRWDDPPSDTGHPGEDIQCRCYAEPVLANLLGIETES